MPAGAEWRSPSWRGVPVDWREEAGCTDAALLGRLRGSGPRALGCHVRFAVVVAAAVAAAVSSGRDGLPLKRARPRAVATP
jgi:hypothetical protein